MKNIILNYLFICCFAFFSHFLIAQDAPPSNGVFRLQNVATGKFLTSATSGASAVTMSVSGDDPSTHFRFVQSGSGSSYNIDSEILGILRAPGSGGPAGAFVVVSTTKASPATDPDKIWTIYHNATNDTYRFESNTAGRFMYHEVNETVTHAIVPESDDRSNWELIPFVPVAPDEDTNPDLTCPASGIYQNNNTRIVDIPNPVNVGTADDRTCYSDYSESSVYGQTWGVYNITENSNHWDAPNTLQPRIERSLSRSGEAGAGSYARFTGTLRILEVGNTSGTSDDGTYLMQAKGKHTGGGGPADPAICLYLAMPVYGDDGNGNQVQVSFDIVREQINFRGGSGAAGRTIVFLKNVLKNEIVDIELEVGFRADPNNPNSKIHYADAVIGGEAFNWNIPEPERGLESGIRYGAYRVKGGRGQMRWANTTYEKVEVAVPLPLDFISFKAQNITAGTQLNWEIANEVNNNYFEILKGNDLNEFQSIGRVKNETGQNYYQFLDRQVSNQTSYYKIKQVDFDGKFSFSKIISVKSKVESMALYPNPVRQNEDFTIESESQQGYQIFNSSGMLLKSGTEKTIKMDLEKGVYFLKQNHNSEIKRFIVY